MYLFICIVMFLHIYIGIYLFMHAHMLSLFITCSTTCQLTIMSEQLERMWQQVIMAHNRMEGLRRHYKNVST